MRSAEPDAGAPEPGSLPPTFAVVDIGTNTVLLLIATVDAAGRIVPVLHEQRMPRLGRGVDARRLLHRASMERAARVVEEYAGIIARQGADAVAVFGTSAVRDAANRDVLADLLLTRTGYPLEVLSGEDEALWTYRGAVSGFPGVSRATVIDIGGGSTEVTSGTEREAFSSVSVDIGSVRLTERLLRHDPPLEEELLAARSLIAASLGGARPSPPGSRLIAVAGTATTLALLSGKHSEFSLDAVSGHVMTLGTVSSLRGVLEHSSSGEIRRMGTYMEGRDDIITAGALILEEAMMTLGFEEVTVSERGVRYGVALREAEQLRGRAVDPGTPPPVP